MKIGDNVYGRTTGKKMGTVVSFDDKFVKVKTVNGQFTDEWPIDSITTIGATVEPEAPHTQSPDMGMGKNKHATIEEILKNTEIKKLDPTYIESLAKKCLEEKAFSTLEPIIMNFYNDDVKFGLPILPYQSWTYTQKMSYIFMNMGGGVGFARYIEELEALSKAPANPKEIVDAILKHAIKMVLAKIGKNGGPV